MHPRRLPWVLTAILLAHPAHARSNGSETGRAGSGCKPCHGSQTTPAVTTTLAVDRTSVEPGGEVSVTVTVASTVATHVAAGLDVAASGGTLVAGEGTRVRSREVTHDGPSAFSGRSTTWTFAWRAPAADGTYTLRAAGNAVNDNGRGSGDGWDVAPAVTVQVGAADTDTPGPGGRDTDTNATDDTPGGAADDDASDDPGTENEDITLESGGCSHTGAPVGLAAVAALGLLRRRR